MVRILQPCIGDVWEYVGGGVYTVVGFARTFDGDCEYVVCEGEGEQRLWPRDTWLHLVAYQGSDARPGAMVRPFRLVRQSLKPRPSGIPAPPPL